MRQEHRAPGGFLHQQQPHPPVLRGASRPSPPFSAGCHRSLGLDPSRALLAWTMLCQTQIWGLRAFSTLFSTRNCIDTVRKGLRCDHWHYYAVTRKTSQIRRHHAHDLPTARRSLEDGEELEVLEGPKENTEAKVVRIRVRALKDAKAGWVTIKGNKGHRRAHHF